MLNDCIFCKIAAKEIPSEIITESENLIAIKDIAPKASIHYLIIPKKHYKDVNDLDDCCLSAEMIALAQEMAQQLEKQEYKLIINNGYSAGQRVFHLHMHFLAGAQLGEV